MATTPPPEPPLDPSQTAPGENLIKLRAKDFFNVDGTSYKPGDTLSLPERLGLGYIGAGAADEIP